MNRELEDLRDVFRECAIDSMCDIEAELSEYFGSPPRVGASLYQLCARYVMAHETKLRLECEGPEQ